MAKQKPDTTENRIQALKDRAAQLAGGDMAFEVSDDCPTDLQEAFWRRVIAVEEAGWTVPFERLVAGDMALPPPDDLNDTQLSAKLWELIQGLALLRIYLYHTDHLSDRELYESLWHDELRELGPVSPNDPGSACHLDMVGSGSEEDTRIYLAYYADEETRQAWREDWPEDGLPETAKPPNDRDRRLPAPDYPHTPRAAS